jgi:hypothetical protein
MSERYGDESRAGDESIWRDAVTLSPDDTKDAKVYYAASRSEYVPRNRSREKGYEGRDDYLRSKGS